MKFSPVGAPENTGGLCCAGRRPPAGPSLEAGPPQSCVQMLQKGISGPRPTSGTGGPQAGYRMPPRPRPAPGPRSPGHGPALGGTARRNPPPRILVIFHAVHCAAIIRANWSPCTVSSVRMKTNAARCGRPVEDVATQHARLARGKPGPIAQIALCLPGETGGFPEPPRFCGDSGKPIEA